ncbi:MAG: metallophosphoesterase [Candidatus Aenigmatarchaeota archaeon]
MMKFVSDEPALFLDELETETLVISDLHIGIEYDLYKKGISIPPRIEKQKKRIMDLVERTGARRVVMLGDVKHNIPNMSLGEKKKMPGFFHEIEGKVEVWIVKGNHDGNIEKIASGAEIFPTDGARDGGFYFNHGHAWPSEEIWKSKVLVRGHSHPAVEFKDQLGFSSVLPCWLRGKIDREKLAEKIEKPEETELEEMIIVPAFSEMISGTPVNREEEESKIGPLLENDIVGLEEMDAYLLDGTFLGKVDEL